MYVHIYVCSYIYVTLTPFLDTMIPWSYLGQYAVLASFHNLDSQH
jgi:hypothetical protein